MLAVTDNESPMFVDIDGDGQPDLLCMSGGRIGYASYDVNGNGRTDVITALDAHGFGVAWFEQNEGGSWTRHLLTDTPEEKGSTGVAFTQSHALDLGEQERLFCDPAEMIDQSSGGMPSSASWRSSSVPWRSHHFSMYSMSVVPMRCIAPLMNSSRLRRVEPRRA